MAHRYSRNNFPQTVLRTPALHGRLLKLKHFSFPRPHAPPPTPRLPTTGELLDAPPQLLFFPPQDISLTPLPYPQHTTICSPNPFICVVLFPLSIYNPLQLVYLAPGFSSTRLRPTPPESSS
jgi:hypothetical protein